MKREDIDGYSKVFHPAQYKGKTCWIEKKPTFWEKLKRCFMAGSTWEINPELKELEGIKRFRRSHGFVI